MIKAQKQVILVGVLALTVAIVAVAAAMGFSSERHPQLHPTRVLVSDHHVSARLYHILKVLREEKAHVHAASAASVPSLPLAVVDGLSGSRPNIDASAAVYAGGHYPTWIVPGATEVCLINDPIAVNDVPGGVCAPVASAERGRLVDSDGNVVFGVAPDGNASVTVADADGTTMQVPVTNNVYEITSGVPDTVTLNDASGITTKIELK